MVLIAILIAVSLLFSQSLEHGGATPKHPFGGLIYGDTLLLSGGLEEWYGYGIIGSNSLYTMSCGALYMGRLFGGSVHLNYLQAFDVYSRYEWDFQLILKSYPSFLVGVSPTLHSLSTGEKSGAMGLMAAVQYPLSLGHLEARYELYEIDPVEDYRHSFLFAIHGDSHKLGSQRLAFIAYPQIGRVAVNLSQNYWIYPQWSIFGEVVSRPFSLTIGTIVERGALRAVARGVGHPQLGWRKSGLFVRGFSLSKDGVRGEDGGLDDDG